jgi:hypothetical protein
MTEADPDRLFPRRLPAARAIPKNLYRTENPSAAVNVHGRFPWIRQNAKITVLI